MFNFDVLKRILSQGQATFPELARKMKVPRNKNRDFSQFLFTLARQKKIFTTANREYFIPKFLGEVEGTIRLNQRGFGFMDLEDGTSIFITANNINSAMDEDTVIVQTFKDPSKEDGMQGFVVKIVKRAREKFVGSIKKFGDKFGILPLDPRIRGKFRFIDESQLEEGQEVVVKIIEHGPTPKIELDMIIGMQGDASIDILSSIYDAGIPFEFDPRTVKEAEQIPPTIDNEDKSGRKDITERLIVTIDGDDTKDFDDAVAVKKLDNGNYLLEVHIADVTHYVKEGTALDDEAKIRGTSVYLADRVIPMLPEALSNGICSLNPHVDRFVLSCEMEIDKQGNTVKYEIYPGIINSSHRLTYQEVNKFYKGEKTFEDKELEKMLSDAKELSDIIRKFKIKEGYIDFEIEESKIIVDDMGKTTDIVVRDRDFSEMLIEDFMVRANETVAYHAFSKELPFIYRVHDKPEAQRLVNLQNVVDVLGIDTRIPQTDNPKDFAIAIEELKKSRFDDFIKIMMLRTMAKAIYSPENIGHFGLASQHYSHFTSPIRRYPDLMVHRMLRTYFFENHMDRDTIKHFDSILPHIAKINSEAEQKAVELERKVSDIKKAEFYEDKIGETHKGTIVSMMKFGFFVEFSNKVDGLLHVENLTDGAYKLDKTGYRMTNGKKVFTVGDEIEVTIVGTAKNEGKIDLCLATQYEKYIEYKNNPSLKQSGNRK